MGGCGGASVRIGATRIRGYCETQPFHRSGRRRSNSAPIGSGSGEHAEPALVHDDTTKEPGSSEMNSNGRNIKAFVYMNLFSMSYLVIIHIRNWPNYF